MAMKKYQMIFLLTTLLLTNLTNAQKGLNISINDKDSSYCILVNNTKLPINSLTLKNFEDILGKPDRLVKQKKGRRKCSGLGGHCGTMIKVPQRLFAYYDKLGLKLFGKDKNEIWGMELVFDSLFSNKSAKGIFSGNLLINSVEVAPLTSLKNLEVIETKSTKSLVNDDPIKCGDKCKIFDALFKPDYPIIPDSIFKLQRGSEQSRLTLTYNKDFELLSLYVYCGEF